MANENVEKLYKVLDAFEKAGKDKNEIEAIRELIDENKLKEALERIRAINNNKEAPKKRGPKKVKKVVKEEPEEEEEEDNIEDDEETELEDEDDQ